VFFFFFFDRSSQKRCVSRPLHTQSFLNDVREKMSLTHAARVVFFCLHISFGEPPTAPGRNRIFFFEGD